MSKVAGKQQAAGIFDPVDGKEKKPQEGSEQINFTVTRQQKGMIIAYQKKMGKGSVAATVRCLVMRPVDDWWVTLSKEDQKMILSGILETH